MTTHCPGAEHAHECANMACRRHGCQGGGQQHHPAAAKTAAHVEKETLEVDVNLPAHDARGGATPLFHKTRLLLIKETGGLCWVCGLDEKHTGHPLEAHHYPVERCFAEAGLVDWGVFQSQALAGDYGPRVKEFDWDKFDPAKWEAFVDDMTVNGLLLCKAHHIGKDEGVHMLPHPIWLAQRFVKEGTQYNHLEVIHRGHVEFAKAVDQAKRAA